jgi:hypothetical protein
MPPRNVDRFEGPDGQRAVRKLPRRNLRRQCGARVCRILHKVRRGNVEQYYPAPGGLHDTLPARLLLPRGLLGAPRVPSGLLQWGCIRLLNRVLRLL